MKLPHITVEYRDTESLAPGKLSLSNTIGFGIHWACILLVVYNSPVFFHFDDQQSQAFYLPLMFAYAVFMLLYAIAHKTARELFITSELRRRNRLIGALMQAASFAAICVTFALGSIPLPLLAFSAMLYGVGGGILLMSFGVSSSVCDSATVTLSTALSFLLAGIIYAGVLTAGHYYFGIAYVVCILLPFVELYCLNVSSKELVDGLTFSTTTIPVKKGALGWRIGTIGVVFGLLIGISASYAFPISPFLDATGPLNISVFIVAASFCCCVFLIIGLLFQRQIVGFSLRTMAPVIGFSFVALLLKGVTSSPTQVVYFSLLAYMLIEACIWICLSDLSQRYRISAFPLFGFGRSFMAFGTIIAMAILNDTTLLSELFDAKEPMIAAALCLLVIGVVMMPRDSEMRRTLVRKAYCLSPLPSMSIAEDMAWDKKAQEIREAHAEAAAPQVPETEAAPLATTPEDKEGASPAPATRLTFDSEPEDPEKKDFKGRYKRKCAAIADTYLLSRREAEVLFLLAKGFSNAMIQEKLFISEGTTNTHMRHIYQKINVHSQQELIRLVESVEVIDE